MKVLKVQAWNVMSASVEPACIFGDIHVDSPIVLRKIMNLVSVLLPRGKRIEWDSRSDVNVTVNVRFHPIVLCIILPIDFSMKTTSCVEA